MIRLPPGWSRGTGGATAPITDPFTAVNTALTLVTVLAALVSLKYARDAARAAWASIEPLNAIHTGIQTSVGSLGGVLTEIRRTRDLAQLGAVATAVFQLGVARQLITAGANEGVLRQAQLALVAALASVAMPELPRCHELGVAPDAATNAALLEFAVNEIAQAISQRR